MIIAGTGTRSVIADIPTCRELVEKLTAKLIEVKATKVISGMAEGFDEIIARAGFKANVPVTLAIPNEGYVKYYWGKNSKTGKNREHIASEIMKRASEIIIVCDSIYVNGEHANFVRNKFMVDQCDALWVYKPESAGTAHCLQYARTVHKPFEIIK